MENRLLFLCTGNFYRSRFAELLFNDLARKAGLFWRAESRGIEADAARNRGPISHFVVEALGGRSTLAWADVYRYPLQLCRSDLERATRIIALNEAEHRAQLDRRFPGWAQQTIFWNVPDLNQAPASEALELIERRTRYLVRSLSTETEPYAV